MDSRKKLRKSDASPLIALADIDRLEILKQLYGRIYITDIVRSEIKADLPDWIEVTTEYDPILYNTLQLQLDKGEASAIALALKNPDSTLIIDESTSLANACLVFDYQLFKPKSFWISQATI